MKPLTHAQIRDFDPQSDLAGVSACLVELQDFERGLDSRMPAGADLVDDYIPWMLQRCDECAGKVIVAAEHVRIVGFATILTRVPNEEMEDGDYDFALVSDLVVTESHRGRGVGRALLRAAEAHARASGARWLRIGVLAGNRSADALYESEGFGRRYVEREKALDES
jgi:GNAT superfamily N-acetyltransferase